MPWLPALWGKETTDSPNKIAGQTFFWPFFSGLFSIDYQLFPTRFYPLWSPPDVIDIGEQYLRVIGWNAFLHDKCQRPQSISGLRDTVRPMIFGISSNVINAILDPFLIFGIAFFPQMGVAGAALAVLLVILFHASCISGLFGKVKQPTGFTGIILSLTSLS